MQKCNGKKVLDHELKLAVGGAGASQMGWALSEKQDVYIHKSGRFAKMKTYNTGTSVRKIHIHTHTPSQTEPKRCTQTDLWSHLFWLLEQLSRFLWKVLFTFFHKMYLLFVIFVCALSLSRLCSRNEVPTIAHAHLAQKRAPVCVLFSVFFFIFCRAFNCI